MNNTILEYLEGYFGGELNESTSDDDIMEAFAKLLETADAVAEFMDINEISARKRKAVMIARARQAGQSQAHDDKWVRARDAGDAKGMTNQEPSHSQQKTARSYGRQLARTSGKRSPIGHDALRKVFKKAHARETGNIQQSAADHDRQQARLKADPGEQAHNRMFKKGGPALKSLKGVMSRLKGG